MFFSVLAAGAFAGCSNDDSDGGASEPSITVDGKENAVGAVKFEGGSLTFSVTSSNDWTLALSDASASSWCSVATSGGRGTTSLTFNIAKWEGAQDDDDRSVTATLTTYGTIAGVSGVQIPARATITVRQNKTGSTVPTTNVAEIRALLKAMDATSGAVSDELQAMTLKGIVVSDATGQNAASGNSAPYYIAVQDANSAAGSGLTLNATAFKTLNPTPGTVIEVALTNAQISYFNDVLQLKINDKQKITTSQTEPLDPVTITVDKILDYESMLVKIENCQPNVDVVGTTWDGNKDFEILPDKKTTFVVRTGSAATFKDETIPEKSGYIVGIATQNKGTLQVMPRTLSDFNGLDGAYSGPEYKTGTISQIAAGEYWEITGSIVAVNTSSFLLADASGYVLVYNSSWTTQTSNTYEIGQKVTVKGKIQQFPEKVGLLQFASPKITEEGNETFNPGEPTVFDAAALTAYESDMKYQYVKLSGVLSITEGESSTTGKYYSYTVAVSGYNGKKVTLAYAFDKDFTDFKNGDVVDVTGFASGTNSDQTAINIMMTSIEKNTSTSAVTITTTPTTFEADGGTQDIAFNAVNVGTNKVYAKVEGEGFSVPSGEVTSPVTVTAEANTGNTREATLTIYLADSQDGTMVVQNSVKLTQKGAGVTQEYTQIRKVADLTEGEYFIGGYGTSAKVLSLYTGSMSGGNGQTSTYTYEEKNGSLTTTSSYTAVSVTLEAVSGIVNAYKIKDTKSGKYIIAKKAASGELTYIDATDMYWVLSDGPDGSIEQDLVAKMVDPTGTIENAALVISTSATSKLLRSWNFSGNNKANGLVFFKKNF